MRLHEQFTLLRVKLTYERGCEPSFCAVFDKGPPLTPHLHFANLGWAIECFRDSRYIYKVLGSPSNHTMFIRMVCLDGPLTKKPSSFQAPFFVRKMHRGPPTVNKGVFEKGKPHIEPLSVGF